MGDESRGKMPELKEISLANIAALFSKQNARFEYFHGKLFSYIPTDATKCAEFLLGLRLLARADVIADAFGLAWQWTRSAYLPYPGYRAAKGALGE